MPVTAFEMCRPASSATHHCLMPSLPGAENSATGTRTRVARVRAEYPNQLDYSGFDSEVLRAGGVDDSAGRSRKNGRASARAASKMAYLISLEIRNWNSRKNARQIATGTWCSGITSASHAEGPGFKSQCVHSCAAVLQCTLLGPSRARAAAPCNHEHGVFINRNLWEDLRSKLVSVCDLGFAVSVV